MAVIKVLGQNEKTFTANRFESLDTMIVNRVEKFDISPINKKNMDKFRRIDRLLFTSLVLLDFNFNIDCSFTVYFFYIIFSGIYC